MADDIWRTCCALHNMLLEVDGLNVEWSGDAGRHEEEDRFFLHYSICMEHSLTAGMISLVWVPVMMSRPLLVPVEKEIPIRMRPSMRKIS